MWCSLILFKLKLSLATIFNYVRIKLVLEDEEMTATVKDCISAGFLLISCPQRSLAAENGDYANAQFPVSGERGEGGNDGTQT